MNIHPFWYICLIVRISLIFLLRFISKSKFVSSFPKIKTGLAIILLIMGLGFMYNGLFGSNNEVQLAKVFWHETRFVHGALYILASYFFYICNIDMNSLVLATDVIFSLIYRIYMKK